MTRASTMGTAARCTLSLAAMTVVILGWAGSARAAHLLVARGTTVERSTAAGGWTRMPVPIHSAIDGIAYDRSQRAYVISFGAPAPCSFAEFRGRRVIARLTQAQFRRASHSSMTANCALHDNPAGGVLMSAGFETLGSATSWSVNLVAGGASALGYGYAATTDGHHFALVQHTYFPRPVLGSAELLAAGELGRPRTLHRMVPMSHRFTYAAPALSPTGDRFAAFRNGTLLAGRLGGTLRPVRRLAHGNEPYDLQWFDSRVVALAGPEGAAAGSLSQIDLGDGRQRTLMNGVSSFAVTP
jgi:hypothetical protein